MMYSRYWCWLIGFAGVGRLQFKNTTTLRRNSWGLEDDMCGAERTKEFPKPLWTKSFHIWNSYESPTDFDFMDELEMARNVFTWIQLP